MNTLLLGLVFLAPPFLKKILLRWFFNAKIGRHVELDWLTSIAARHIELGDHSAIRMGTLIRLNGDFKLGAYGEISIFNLIYGSSTFSAGNATYIGPQCIINAEETVQIGNGSALGPRSMVFTHGSFLPYNEGYWARRAGVTIGNKVWCAAGVFLHPGVEIGDDTFVNSRSVVMQSIPGGSVVEGNPAQVVYPIERIKRKMTPARLDAAMALVLRDFVEVGLRRELGVTEIEEREGYVRARWRGALYEIALVRATNDAACALTAPRQIYLVNRADWSAPAGAWVFDCRAQRTRYLADPIHTALRMFMLRYYGIRFEDDC
ncbi:MAG: acyltransferase [Chloroflexi bacterium]|nr:acyltransferase [Chloroflexota bacterium]